ncbi:branched-chain amino acid transport system II carrier protein [Arcanobacterium phocae]|uniref:branched-chain amino acid transport system II carrier protein n=1 Tax=Arcanobacterium phocae TaxID=131112 RepID=UPI001C0EA71C|nr:branched-chain amino acid transport system II carrier protein [Arcanobacterium phocae]
MFSHSTKSIIFAGFALFAMFFGAGNLILPAMIGVEAGGYAYPAVFGFVLTGAVLTVAGMIAAGSLKPGETRLADRVGPRFGLIFTTVLFVATAMLYPTPRVAAVSFEMAAVPIVGSGHLQLFFYTVVFFGICYVLVRQPAKIIERIGGFLTPVLIVLLIALVVASYTLPDLNHEPIERYAQAPVANGLIEGYFTMDSLATLMYGPVIVGALAAAGFSGAKLRRGMAGASILAGSLLAACYIGLVHLGAVGNGVNGAVVVTSVSHELFGRTGQLVFGLIVFLACLTTALGLLASSSDYFHKLFPKISQHTWLLIHLAVVFPLSNLGLETILSLVAPLNQLLYPITISIIVVALLDMALPKSRALVWSYRLGTYTAVVLAIPEALNSTGMRAFAPLRTVLDLFPMGHLQMAWVVPTLLAIIIGLLYDLAGDRARRTVEA